ncbi:unnamed protein product, partial [Porites evermanni]
ERSRCQAYEPEEDEISLYPDDSLSDEEDEPDVNNQKKSNRIRYPVRRHPKEGKNDEEKTKADREKMCSSDDNKPRWSEMAMFTGLMNQVQEQKQLRQQNLQVMLAQQNKVFIALLENSKKQ